MINKFRNLFRVHLHFSKKSAWMLLALLMAATLIFEKASALEYDDFDDDTRAWINSIKNDGGFKYLALKQSLYLIDSGQTIFNGHFGDALVETAKYVKDSDKYQEDLVDRIVNGSASSPVPTSLFKNVDVYCSAFFAGRCRLASGSWSNSYTTNSTGSWTNSSYDIGYDYIRCQGWQNPSGIKSCYSFFNTFISESNINVSIDSLLVNTFNGSGYSMQYAGTNSSFIISFDVVSDFNFSHSNITDMYINSSRVSLLDFYTLHAGDHVQVYFRFDSPNTFEFDCPVTPTLFHEYSISIGGDIIDSVSRPLVPDLSQYKPLISNYGDLNQNSNLSRWENDNRIFNDIVNYINDIEKETDIKETIAGVDKHDGIYELNENTSIISYPSEFFSAFCLSLSENYQSYFSFDIEEVRWNDIVLFPESHIVIRPETFIPSDLVDVFRYIILFMLVIPWILYLFRTIRGSEVLEDD